MGWGRKITEVKYHFHHALSRACPIRLIVVEMFALITWMRWFVRLPHCGLTLFVLSLSIMCSWYVFHTVKMTEDEMVGWHHQLNEPEFEQILGDGKGQGSLACYGPWGCRESDTTERLNNKYCVLWSEVTVYNPRLRTGQLNFASERGQHRHPGGTWFKGHWLENIRTFAKTTLRHIGLTTRRSACPFKNVWLWVQCKDK